jgi:hypothetical protein
VSALLIRFGGGCDNPQPDDVRGLCLSVQVQPCFAVPAWRHWLAKACVTSDRLASIKVCESNCTDDKPELYSGDFDVLEAVYSLTIFKQQIGSMGNDRAVRHLHMYIYLGVCVYAYVLYVYPQAHIVNFPG